MWNWIKDQELENKFKEFSRFEKTLLFVWILLGFIRLQKSNTYNAFFGIFQSLGVTIDAVAVLVTIIVLLMLAMKQGFFNIAFGVPACNFKILSEKIILRLLISVGALGLLSLFLLYSRPEIWLEMKKMAESAQILDWVCAAFIEELTDRFALYYLALSCFGRTGAFCLSTVGFAIAHAYSSPYALSMLFPGALSILLLLWSGSPSLPFLVHILSNSVILFLARLGL
ncbi:CPBP family intramembrane metalloprotease [Candidatus Giovannonibacteria bacterium]|nr:CPBP family intramembrane metalloprotease [Candidatus Giovannonibacteria bacterium]